MKPIQGKVISNKASKSATVAVETMWQHPAYKKIIRRVAKYFVHDEIGTKVGDEVLIQQTRPISKRKRWKIIEVIK